MIRALILLLAIVMLLTACGQSRVVRREPAHAEPRRTAVVAREQHYVVRQGDTLYGIAFRHGLDFRDVAAWNRIGPPYTIYPGQALRLRTGASVASTTRPAPAPARSPAGVRNPPPVHPVSPTSSTTQGQSPATGTSTPRTAPVTTMPTPTAHTPPPVVPPTTPAPLHSGRWSWPASGQIIGRYVAGDPTKQGVDIAGTAGQPVLAAADGIVVYSGTGLVGYGEVIIVKHSDEWLSAYGHNRKRLVAEGDAVKAGQMIAELGRSGTSRDMLHFEIRRNGKPVDPLGLLPPR